MGAVPPARLIVGLVVKPLMVTPYGFPKQQPCQMVFHIYLHLFFPILHFSSGGNLTFILLLDVLPHNSFLRNSISSPQGLFEIKEKEVANLGS